MATKKATTKVYGVTFHVDAELIVNVAATSPEDAIAKAREFPVGEIIAEYDEILDIASTEVVGVWLNK